jgi:hypothetical protein
VEAKQLLHDCWNRQITDFEKLREAVGSTVAYSLIGQQFESQCIQDQKSISFYIDLQRCEIALSREKDGKFIA